MAKTREQRALELEEKTRRDSADAAAVRELAKAAAERLRQGSALTDQLRKSADIQAKARTEATLKKNQALAKAESDAKCTHKHLKFKEAGRKLACIDCDRVWDAGADYFNPKLGEFDTRHDRFSMARTKKL